MKKAVSLFIVFSLMLSVSACTVVSDAGGAPFESIITFDNLSLFCATNVSDAENFEEPIRGIMLEFHGISDQSLAGNPAVGRRCTAQNVLYVFPSNGPWNWMDKTAVRMTDRIIDILIEHFDLDKDIPVVSTGHSMGGAGAITYSVYSKHNVTAVAADSAVCDLFAYAEYNASAWRSIIRALGDYDMPFEDAIKTVSPIHLIDELKDIPYFLVHGGSDTDVPAEDHSDILNSLLLGKGFDVVYKRPETMTHVAMPGVIETLYFEFIFSNMNNG